MAGLGLVLAAAGACNDAGFSGKSTEKPKPGPATKTSTPSGNAEPSKPGKETPGSPGTTSAPPGNAITQKKTKSGLPNGTNIGDDTKVYSYIRLN